MTKANAIPEEVLTIIFEKLHKDDLRKCQYVCSAWYLPAHLHVLKQLQFYDYRQKLKKIHELH